MIIIGISAYYHDSAASLLINGELVAAAQEERFTRKKNDNTFPIKSIQFCLNFANIDIESVDVFVFYEKPLLKFDRILETYISFSPFGFKFFKNSLSDWVKTKLLLKRDIITNIVKNFPNSTIDKEKIKFSNHHLSHASSAFYPSPYEDSVILTFDAVGEWSTSSISFGSKNNIKFIKEISFPHSIGLLYSTFTSFLGFKVNDGEYKVMGLAPYGNPKYVDLIKKEIIHILDDGSIQLNMKYFDFCTGSKMFSKKFNDLFNCTPRLPNMKLEQVHMDLASSIQKVTEEVICKIAAFSRKLTGSKNLCLAGGVALNSVANGILKNKQIFKNIWVQPAAGDSGGSLGAAYAYWHLALNNSRVANGDMMQGSYLGPRYENKDIEGFLKKNKIKFHLIEGDNFYDEIAKYIAKGKIIGWFQGRMEFGPRALGARSILADPRIKDMQSKLNLKIKFRESFRPFAPSVLKEFVDNWFDFDTDSPYMLFVTKVKNNKLIKKNIAKEKQINQVRSIIPAVTHVDNSARIQTVDGKFNIKFYRLIKSFHKITKCPIIINTSFNVMNEPIVCSPDDAFHCFMGTGMDVLVLENYVIHKAEQIN